MSIRTWEERVTLPESKLDADDCKLAEIVELRAEIERLEGSELGLNRYLATVQKSLSERTQELAAVHEAKMASWVEQQAVINNLRAELAKAKQQKSIGSLKVLKPGEAIATAIEQSVCAFPECCPEHIHLVNR